MSGKLFNVNYSDMINLTIIEVDGSGLSVYEYAESTFEI